MRFGLRRQLLAIGLFTVALPVVSVGYIRATEQALRETQSGLLMTTGRSVAPLVNDALGTLADPREQAPWFVEPLTREPLLDGFVADWNALVAPADAAEGGPALRTAAGSYNGALFLHADVVHGSDVRPEFTVSCTTMNGSLLLSKLAPVASGVFTNDPLSEGAAPLRGAWIPDADGSQLELRIPSSPCERQLGLWVKLNDSIVATHAGSVPGPMLSVSGELSAALQEHRIAGTEMFAISPEGWRLTPLIGNIPNIDSQPNEAAAPWLARLFQGGRTTQETAHRGFDQRSRWLNSLLQGDATSRRARQAGSERLISEVAIPLESNGEIVAGLVLRQPTDAILSLTNPVRTRMTLAVLGVTVLVVALLLAFATVLSLRVRRLSHAASTALDARGRITTTLPGSTAKDEVGDVARGFESLLRKLDEQQTWLQSLADNLSHELRTPIAVVQSSLDNLRHTQLSKDAEALLDRASGGVERLRATLLGMTRANRAEQATRDAEYLEVNLSDIARQLQRAYADTFSTHRFGGGIDPGITVIGNPDLLVQMIDKLVENAVTFAPEGSEIALSVSRGSSPTISIANEGSSLPEGDLQRLFMPLVSHRGERSGEGHLGFGLYIARLIAQAHGATVEARNTEQGVAFDIRFDSAKS
ncbi:MAG: ATP-binding protein [Pseudomonadota bacterium]